MENPRTWCETRKLIMSSLSGQEVVLVRNVAEALIVEKKVRDEDRAAALAVLAGAKAKFDKQMASGACGLSLISIMYWELRGAHLLIGDGDGKS